MGLVSGVNLGICGSDDICPQLNIMNGLFLLCPWFLCLGSSHGSKGLQHNEWNPGAEICQDTKYL